MRLLEREHALAALQQYLDEARAGAGRLVLVSGEAGIGKTAVVEAFSATVSDLPWVAATCDGLFTPRALGPLFDLAREFGGEMQAACSRGAARDELFAVLLTALADAAPAVVLVIEDLHWADEATLDLVRFLGRRIHTLPCLIIITYRDDAPSTDDALRILVGALAAERGTRRIGLSTLSESAVAELAAGTRITARELMRLSGGNPFFATEILRSPRAGVPTSAREAVLATVARLSPPAKRTVGVAALISGRFDPDLLEELGGDPEDIDEMLAAGLVVSDGSALRFRHEIIRLAVADEMPGFRKRLTHARLLAALRRSGVADVTELAYHAQGAGDGAAAVEYATAAGRRAAELGAHREAVAHFSAALRFADGAPVPVIADLHQRLANEAALVERWHAAVEAGERSAVLWSELEDPLREGDALRLRSATTWRTARGAESALLAEEAVRRLQPLGATPELARAYALLGALRALSGDLGAAADTVGRARALADELDLPDVRSHAIMTGAIIAWNEGGPWVSRLHEALRIARDAGAHEQVARTYANLHNFLRASHDFTSADACYAEATAFCERHELTTYGLYLRASHGASLAGRGRWDEAAAISRDVLAQQPVPTTTIDSNIVLGSILARRGDPAGLEHLDDAVSLATRADIADLRCAAHVARAESRWLDGARDAAAADLRIAAEVARSTDPWTRATVAVWQRRLGGPVTVPWGDAPPPLAASRDLDFGLATKLWDDVNRPYEAALAQSDAGTEPALRQALQRFQDLGATAAERLTRRRMRALGIRGIPSGAQHFARANPAGLTRREQEVLIRVSAGLTNAQIAEELVLSPRTVDHHVSALLAKLGASSRALAVERAAALGVLDAKRTPSSEK